MRAGGRWRAVLFAAVMSLGCNRPPAAAPPAPAAPEPPARTAQLAKVRSAAGLPLLEAPARVLAAPDASADVVPPFRARVVRIHVRPGQPVERGAPIMDVVMPEVVRAAGAYVAAGTRLAAYGKQLEQLRALRKDGMVRLGDLAEAETRVAEAQADQQAALGTLRGADLSGADAARLLGGAGTVTLRSPLPGLVTAVRATLGETHENSDLSLAQIVGRGEVQIEAHLSRPLPEGAALRFTSPPRPPCPVTLGSVAPAADPRDGTTLAWFQPQGGCDLPQGLQGKLQVQLDPRGGAVAVPARALLPANDAAPPRVRRRRGGADALVEVSVLAVSGADALVRAADGALVVGDEVAEDPEAAP